MRPWLVVCGTVFVLVGVGALGGLLLFSPTPGTDQASEQLIRDVTPPNGFSMLLIAGTAHPHGTLTVRWTSTAAIAVKLNAGSCSDLATGCDEPLLFSWASVRNGSYSFTGPLTADYVLAWTTAPNVTAVVNATSLTDWPVGSGPTVADLAGELAGGLLAGIGAVVLFLGLFLRGGYRASPPIVSRSADDAEAAAAATGPRTATSTDGSGPPRPGPPSRSG
jgi:hypothetical protein